MDYIFDHNNDILGKNIKTLAGSLSVLEGATGAPRTDINQINNNPLVYVCITEDEEGRFILEPKFKKPFDAEYPDMKDIKKYEEALAEKQTRDAGTAKGAQNPGRK